VLLLNTQVVRPDPYCSESCNSDADCTGRNCEFCGADNLCHTAERCVGCGLPGGPRRTLHTFTNATCRSICGLPCATSDECGGECQVCAQSGRYRGYCVPSGNNGTCGVACGGALC